MLNAPLDWPDCCALCSDIDGDDAATTACTGWSFHPSTGSCQLLATTSLDDSVSASWQVNGTVHGFPGYFEPPVTGCSTRQENGLCVGRWFDMLSGGTGLVAICIPWGLGFGVPRSSKRWRCARKLIRDQQSSRLQKATCVKVSTTQFRTTTTKGRHVISNDFEGTFITRDGSAFDAPAPGVDGITLERKMLHVLFSTRLKPLADRDVAARCRTPHGLRAEFSSLLRSARSNLMAPPSSTIHRPQEEEQPPSFDCLLLVDRDNQAERKVRR